MLPNVELQKLLAEEILNIHNLDGGYVFSLIRAFVDVAAPVFCFCFLVFYLPPSLCCLLRSSLCISLSLSLFFIAPIPRSLPLFIRNGDEVCLLGLVGFFFLFFNALSFLSLPLTPPLFFFSSHVAIEKKDPASKRLHLRLFWLAFGPSLGPIDPVSCAFDAAHGRLVTNVKILSYL